MFTNMFWFDRALRTALGLIMLTMGYLGSELILYCIGGLLALTGIVGFCPIIALLGHTDEASPSINTKPHETSQKAMA